MNVSDKNNWNSLIWAANHGNFEMVRFLNKMSAFIFYHTRKDEYERKEEFQRYEIKLG